MLDTARRKRPSAVGRLFKTKCDILLLHRDREEPFWFYFVCKLSILSKILLIDKIALQIFRLPVIINKNIFAISYSDKKP
jgi:hypothetical protein